MKVLTFLTVVSFVGVTFSVDPRCSGVPPGKEYLFPYPSDCSRYIECTLSGDAVDKTCASGFWFNEALQACDHPSNSGCVPLACPPSIVDYYAYPSDCTRYIECYNGKAEVHECPGGFYFNALEKMCTFPDSSGCGIYSSSVAPTWTTPTDSTCVGVIPGYTELRPYSGDCSQYVKCVGSVASYEYCPTGLYFDPHRVMCDFPDAADCPAKTDSAIPSSSLIPSIVDPRCSVDSYWQISNCSYTYLECYKGDGFLMDCPGGFVYDECNGKCVDPSRCQCGSTSTTTASPSTPADGSDPDCFLGSTYYDFLFPYPGDCTKYLECATGQKLVRNCPDGLWFNAVLEVCDYPYESGC